MTANKHAVLLGDSIFDNASYVPDGLPVSGWLKKQLPHDWQSSLLAIDGSVCLDVLPQLDQLPADASHLIISCGGNDALLVSGVAEVPVQSVHEALGLLADISASFAENYRHMLIAATRARPNVAVCTVYDGVPDLSRELRTALALFNEVILREAAILRLPVIDLRIVCDSPADYSSVSSIEPSEQGGEKIASAIARLLTDESAPVSVCRIQT